MKFFIYYGLPERIHSDQGCDFYSKLVHELSNSTGSSKDACYLVSPSRDPQPECLNQTLLDMLGTLSREKKTHWSRHVATVVHAYNSIRIYAKNCLPVDMAFGANADIMIIPLSSLMRGMWTH